MVHLSFVRLPGMRSRRCFHFHANRCLARAFDTEAVKVLQTVRPHEEYTRIRSHDEGRRPFLSQKHATKFQRKLIQPQSYE